MEKTDAEVQKKMSGAAQKIVAALSSEGLPVNIGVTLLLHMAGAEAASKRFLLTDCIQALRSAYNATAQAGALPARNALCPCGSGKKYKKCHIGRELPPPAKAEAPSQPSEAVAPPTAEVPTESLPFTPPKLGLEVVECEQCPKEDPLPEPVEVMLVAMMESAKAIDSQLDKGVDRVLVEVSLGGKPYHVHAEREKAL